MTDKNPDVRREKQKLTWKRYIEKHPNYYKEVYQKNKQREAERKKLDRLKRPDVYKARNRQDYLKFPERYMKWKLISLQKRSTKLSILPNQYNYLLWLWSKSVKKLNNNVCQICDMPAKHAHHIFPKHQFPELSFNLNNGIALCEQHHKEIHKLNRSD